MRSESLGTRPGLLLLVSLHPEEEGMSCLIFSAVSVRLLALKIVHATFDSMTGGLMAHFRVQAVVTWEQKASSAEHVLKSLNYDNQLARRLPRWLGKLMISVVLSCVK